MSLYPSRERKEALGKVVASGTHKDFKFEIYELGEARVWSELEKWEGEKTLGPVAIDLRPAFTESIDEPKNGNVDLLPLYWLAAMRGYFLEDAFGLADELIEKYKIHLLQKKKE